MSRGVNKVILLGNVGRDPEVTYSPNGTAIARFSVATSRGKKSESGQWEEETEWHNVKLFGRLAETAGQYLTKGAQVFIEGRITYRKYEHEGVKRYFTEIVGENMQLLGKREESARRDAAVEPDTPPPPPPEATPPPDYDGDLPF